MTQRRFAEKIYQSLTRHFKAPQWLVGFDHITESRYQGFRPRIVLSRRLCIFKTFDLSNVPARARKEALQNKVRVHSPFSEPSYTTSWQGDGRVAVWIWDKEALSTRIPVSEKYHVVPESLLTLSPSNSGLNLQVMEGEENQTWNGTWLRESRFIFQPKTEWPSYSQPAPMQQEEKKWWAHVIAGSITFLFLLIIVAQGGSILRLKVENAELEAALLAGKEGVAEQRFSRGLAQRLKANIEAQQALLAPDFSEFTQKLANAMPQSAGQWREMTIQPSAMSLLLKDAQPDPRIYVQRLEENVGLRNVSVDMDLTFGQVAIRAEIPHNAMRYARETSQ